MLKKSIFILLIFFFSQSLFAGNEGNKKLKTFSVSGKVLDNTGSLTGVKVVLNNKEVTVYTDFDGNFTINNVKEGLNTISFSMVAYGTKTLSINPSEKSSLEVKLYGK